mgnify:CR=1 FL=1
MTTLLVDFAGGPAALLLAQTAAPAAAPAPSVGQAGTATSEPTPLPPGAPQPSSLGNLIMPLLFLGIFLLLFAPQIKRNRDHQKMLKALETGDEVVTTGGMFGIITQVKPDRFVVEIAKGVRIEINRANVEARAPDPNAGEGNKDKKA